MTESYGFFGVFGHEIAFWLLIIKNFPVKGRTSRKIQQEFPALRKRYWGRRFWARGYFCTTSGNIIVAHNAGFDRTFAEAEFDFFADKPWACSMSQIPWRDEGLEGGKLEYLAMKSGFFYDAHRASTDCYAGIELLARNLPKTGRLAMSVLLEEARKSTKRIWAERAPFDFKDILKERGYRWNDGNDGRPKAWNIDISEDGLNSELLFLRDEIYQREVDLPITTITARDRFSNRV